MISKGAGLRVLLTVGACFVVVLCSVWLNAAVAAVVLSVLLALSTLAAVGASVLATWRTASMGVAASGEPWLRDFAAARDAAALSLCLYVASAGLVWWRYLQIKARGQLTTIETLINEAMPAAAEAAAGAALLARCSAAARRRTLGELDREMKTQWATSLRGLSAKLADLRRLAGAGDTSTLTGSAAASSHLCSKLEMEMRRVLGAEHAWMRRALDLENDGALVQALFWWLHDDGEGGAWGTPRPATFLGHDSDQPSTLEKLAYPSLSSAGVGPQQLRSPPPELSRLREATTALEDRHYRLDRLRMAVRAETHDGPFGEIQSEGALGALRVALRALCRSRRSYANVEAGVHAFCEQCERVAAPAMVAAGQRGRGAAAGPCGRCWEAALPLSVAALAVAISAALLASGLLRPPARGGGGVGGGLMGWSAMVELAVFLWANYALMCRLREIRLPYLWARLSEGSEGTIRTSCSLS